MLLLVQNKIQNVIKQCFIACIIAKLNQFYFDLKPGISLTLSS